MGEVYEVHCVLSLFWSYLDQPLSFGAVLPIIRQVLVNFSFI